jgi:septum formation protein
MKPQLILASTSSFRKKQLEEMNLYFTTQKPLFNEDDYKNKSLPPQELSKILAEKKARSLQVSHPDQLILGCDQVCARENEIFGKTSSWEATVHQLLKLQGRTHTLYTSICLIGPGNIIFQHTDLTHLKMRKLDSKILEPYVKKYETWQAAGGYKFECEPERLFEEIQTQDPSAIIGIPKLKLMSWLLELGYVI